MTKIMSNSKEPAVTYRHDYATEAKNEFEGSRYEYLISHHFITTIFPSNLPHITGCWRFPDASTTPWCTKL